jgi:large subunit ribosomal protein L4
MGPKPRDFSKDLPRTMKRLALRSALSTHARQGSLTVVEGVIPAEPKTKAVAATLKSLGVERNSLLVSGEFEPVLMRAARNIPIVKALPAANLNVVDLVNAHRLVVTEDAVRAIESRWGGANVKPARGAVEATDA